MNKTFLPLASLLAAASFGAGAQTAPALTNSGFPGLGTDTAAEVVNNALFANLATPASNGSWDVSTANYGMDNDLFVRVTPTNGAFAGATFARPMQGAFAGAAGYSVSGYYTRTNTGVTRVGDEISTRQAIPLSQFGAGPNDSLIFPVQTIGYTAPVTVMQFPATAGSHWTSVSSSTLNFNLTYAPFYTNTPGQRRSQLTQSDSVIGWGRMRVKNRATTQSLAWMNVLQIRTRYINRDSFYLGGTLPPQTLLDAFGLQQGMRDTTYEVRYFRAGEYMPLADLEYYTPTVPTGAPDFMFVAQNRLPDAAGVQDAAGSFAVKIYPNPAHSCDQLSVQLPNGKTYAYQVLSVTGAMVAGGELHATAGNVATIAMPQSATPGIYYLMLRGGAAGDAPLVVPFELN